MRINSRLYPLTQRDRRYLYESAEIDALLADKLNAQPLPDLRAVRPELRERVLKHVGASDLRFSSSAVNSSEQMHQTLRVRLDRTWGPCISAACASSAICSSAEPCSAARFTKNGTING